MISAPANLREFASVPAHRQLRFWPAVELSLIRRSSLYLVEEHYVLASALSEGSTVVDLGANLGRFSSALVDRFHCSCVALEPAPENVKAIPEHPRIQVLQGAIAETAGTGELKIADDCTANRLISASNASAAAGVTGHIAVKVFDYRSLLQAAGIRQVDLLKVDIEGAEWGLFNSLTDAELLAIGQITVEFHDFIEDLGDVRRTWEVYQRLLRLGFHCIEDPVNGSYNVLFVHRTIEIPIWDTLLVCALSTLRRCAWKLGRVIRLLRSTRQELQR